MKKEKFTELANLYLLDELSAEERTELENAMLENDELKDEFENIKRLCEALVEGRPSPAGDAVLDSARGALMRSVRNEMNKTSFKDKILGWIKDLFFTNYKIAFGGAATMAVGVFIGYLFFSPNFIESRLTDNSKSVDLDNIESGNYQISNVKFPNPFGDKGDIEISFDAVKPISYKGKMSDPMVQRLLATALVTEPNPGLRLKTVSTISEQVSENKFIPDPKIKSSLITALKIDSNPAVRKEAMTALLNFPFDTEIRDAFLFVLSNDKNSGMRVYAINSLFRVKEQGNSLDDKIKNVLNKKAETDDSDFIRMRAASLLQEVK